MNIRYIEYFIEIAKEKSFTKAANNIHISQPALSKVIKKLEAELNIKLIDRTAKNFKLTESGEIFFENGKKALENINLEFNSLLDSIHLKKGKIKIGIPPVISTVYFTKVISMFQKEFPEVEICMIEDGANKIKEMTINSEVDLGIVILPVESEELEVVKIKEERNILVLNKKHKFARRKKVKLKELCEENFISLNDRFMLYNEILLCCKKEGFIPKIKFKSSQWDFVAEMVALDEGIAILPKPIVDRFINENIKLVELDNPKIPWEIAIITKKNKYISYIAKEFVKYILNKL